MLLASDRPNRHRPSSWPADESFALPIGVGRTAPRKSALIRPRRGAETDERSRAYAARASSCLPVICLPPLFRGLTASPACSPAVASPVEAARPHGCASKITIAPPPAECNPLQHPDSDRFCPYRFLSRHRLRPGRNRLDSPSFPHPSTSFPHPSTSFPHTPTSFPHTPTSFPHTPTSFPHTPTSFPRRRESPAWRVSVPQPSCRKRKRNQGTFRLIRRIARPLWICDGRDAGLPPSPGMAWMTGMPRVARE